MLQNRSRWTALALALLLVVLAAQAALADDRSLRGKLTVSDIVEYRSFDEYAESPVLTELVEKGLLPPVEERLPVKPRVLKSAGMVDGPGVYGDVWRDTFAVPVESWNWGAGQTQGYFGVNELVQEALVDLFPMWMMEEPEPAPRLATDWEWSEDGYSLTMNLVEGARWSDGAPFTADDVLFTFNHYILDPNIPSWTRGSAWVFGGEETRLEKIDDYTIRFHFGAPFPVGAFWNMGFLNFSIMPKHVFSHWHPAFNPDMTYQDLLTAAPPEDLPPVTMGAFVPVIYRPSELLVLVRNPYYFQVDEEGKQLPYMDEVWYNEAAEGTQRTFNLIANVGDRDNVENPQIFGMMFEESQKPDSHFSLSFEDFGIGYRLMLNLSTTLGINDDRDRALRELFRDLRFREALSYAVDRQGLATAAFPGPLTAPWYGGYPAASPYYDDELVRSFDYDPNRAAEILTEMGFVDTTGDGIRNWPSDHETMAGRPLVIEVMVGEDQVASVEAAQALVALFRNIGIDLRIRVVSGPIGADRQNAGTWELMISRVDQPTPDIHMGTYGPSTVDNPVWHRGGPGGRDLLPFEQEMADLLEEAQFTSDAARRTEIFREVLRLSTENVYTIGLYQARRGLAVHNRIRNIPEDLPTYMFEWGMENMPWLAWTPEGEQFTPRYLHLIPTSETYQNRAWQE